MGRKPNPVILSYFERGEKLKDNSNRYAHTCVKCGEHFAKGRIDSLTNHLTKNCPAISEAERINACLALHGIHGNSAAARNNRANNAQNNAAANALALRQDNWTALETLAEVSRQIDLSEKHDDHVPHNRNQPVDATSAPFADSLLAPMEHHDFQQLHEQFTMEGQPLTFDGHPQTEGQPGLDGTQHEMQHGMHHDMHHELQHEIQHEMQHEMQHGMQHGMQHEMQHEMPHEMQHEIQHEHELTTEEKLQNLLQADGVPTDSNLSVAVAATARLNPSFLDPQLHQVLHNEATSESMGSTECPVTSAPDENLGAVESLQFAPGPEVNEEQHLPEASFPPESDVIMSPSTELEPPVPNVATATSEAPAAHVNESLSGEADMLIDFSPTPATDSKRPATPGDAQANHVNQINQVNITETPWAELTYIPEGLQAPAMVSSQSQQLAFSLAKGGMRMETISPNGTRSKHARARFDSERRKEVQEVRRIGACIRCRILRKVCSKGTPCDTCRKVLSPRVWLTGCVRTKLAEQLELYSAGVQVVIAQKRINELKSEYTLSNKGVVIEASHFKETGHQMVLQMLEGHSTKDVQEQKVDPEAPGTLVMIDSNKEDIPAKVEAYMRQVLPELIKREQSSHVRVTLECAMQVAEESNDELLRRSLDLWGLVELMDRERQWSFLRKMSDGSGGVVEVTDDSHNEIFTNICTQLTAGAERKAAATSKSLLNGIQRNLQDGKTKLGFPMFLTAMVFLNCVEKTTWAFKAWEGESIRQQWPLEKQPDHFYHQGYGLCDLLRMLLMIRHTLPRATAPDSETPLVADEQQDEIVKKYYRDLNVTCAFLQERRDHFSFDQSDSRSLEFLYCSNLLLT
ncbi:hypothetical protein PG987_011432 [Apiospora arundinis]